LTAAEDKNSKLMSSEGMEATEEEIQESFADGEGDQAMEMENSQGISLDG
jgi:translation initiation factor eIF-2B subunit gamma